MKFLDSALVFSFLSGLCAAIDIPGTGIATIQVSANSLRTYYHDGELNGKIFEASTVVNDPKIIKITELSSGYIHRGSPLAAVSWVGENCAEIRVYYISSLLQINELIFSNGRWELDRNELEIFVQQQANPLLNAILVNNIIMLDYIGEDGSVYRASKHITETDSKTNQLQDPATRQRYSSCQESSHFGKDQFKGNNFKNVDFTGNQFNGNQYKGNEFMNSQFEDENAVSMNGKCIFTT